MEIGMMEKNINSSIEKFLMQTNIKFIYKYAPKN